MLAVFLWEYVKVVILLLQGPVVRRSMQFLSLCQCMPDCMPEGIWQAAAVGAQNGVQLRTTPMTVGALVAKSRHPTGRYDGQYTSEPRERRVLNEQTSQQTDKQMRMNELT